MAFVLRASLLQRVCYHSHHNCISAPACIGMLGRERVWFDVATSNCTARPQLTALQQFPFSYIQNKGLLRSYCSQHPFASISMHVTTNVASRSDKDILDKLVRMGSVESSSGSEASLLCKELFQAKYSELQSLPWLQQNVRIAYIQLLMNNKFDTLMKPIWDHEGMAILISSVIHHCNSFTTIELCESFAELLFIGLTPTSDVAQKMFVKAINSIPDMDMYCLELMSFITRTIDKEWQILRQLLSRLQELLTDADLEWDTQDLAYLASFSVSQAQLFSKELAHLVSSKISAVLSNPKSAITPDQLGAYARMAHKMLIATKLDKVCAREVVAKIVDRCVPLIDEMKPHNIAEICHALKRSRCYERDLAQWFERRSCKLLHDDMKPCEVSNLMYSLYRYTAPDIKRQFENILMQKINDIDVMLVSNLSESLLEMQTKNYDLIFAFQKQIIAHATGTLSYSSRFAKVSRFLLRQKFLDPGHQEIFKGLVVRAIENKMSSVQVHQLGNYSSYLLPLYHHAMDENFVNKLLSIIPRWHHSDLFRLALGLSSMRRPLTIKLQRQVAQIQHVLQQSIIDNLDHVDRLDYLFHLTSILVVHNLNRDPALTDKILQLYMQFVSSLTDITASRLAQILCGLRYHMPELYEELVNFMVKKRDTFSQDRIRIMFESCASVGHVPKDQAGCLQVALQGYHDFRRKGQVLQQLKILHNLSLCQLYPEEELSEVFNIDFIELVDRYMEEHPPERHHVEHLMMVLNRTVMLECPQIDVPWFHEYYCQERFKADDSLEDTLPTVKFFDRFCEDVKHALEEVLHGDRFLRRRTFSPYFYGIDLECMLDSKQNPVPIQDFHLPAQPDWQRVAILVLTEKSYCYNSKHLTGPELMRKRHLEILGYKYIEIPQFEWYSMGLTDWQAKIDYLHAKIFS